MIVRKHNCEFYGIPTPGLEEFRRRVQATQAVSPKPNHTCRNVVLVDSSAYELALLHFEVSGEIRNAASHKIYTSR
jgi:hypothetical protein